MKIGILTFHRSYNYGAFMQCYALSKRIKKDFPDVEVEVIDYATSRMYRNYDLSLKKYIFGNKDSRNSPVKCCKKAVKYILDPNQLKRTRKLHNAFEKDLVRLPLSDFKIVSDDYKELIEKIRGMYDIVVVGSDSVWEFITYGFPNAYYLPGDIGAVKMSYAASADRMHINLITEEQKAIIGSAVSNFKYVGIRDVSTENFLNNIVPDIPKKHTCDPTFLLDMDSFSEEKQRVEKMLIEAGIDLSKPIIGLMCGENIADRAISHFGKEYQYVSVYWYNKHADAYLGELTPAEWTTVFSFFSLTVTRFFHGTMLSLMNTTPTLTIDEWSMVDEKHISKLEDLYNRLDMKDHFCRIEDFNDDKKLVNIVQRAKNFINNGADRQKIKEAIKKESENYESFRYALENVIHELVNREDISK